jgi:hypothetical protein
MIMIIIIIIIIIIIGTLAHPGCSTSTYLDISLCTVYRVN